VPRHDSKADGDDDALCCCCKQKHQTTFQSTPTHEFDTPASNDVFEENATFEDILKYKRIRAGIFERASSTYSRLTGFDATGLCITAVLVTHPPKPTDFATAARVKRRRKKKAQVATAAAKSHCDQREGGRKTRLMLPI
jgi:hypothetical protein